MPRPSPEIWSHFDKIIGVGKIATCKYCKKDFSYKGTTSNLKAHLKCKHVAVYYNMVLPCTAEVCSGGGKLEVGDSDGAGTSGGDVLVVGCGDSTVDSSGSQHWLPVITSTYAESFQSTEPPNEVQRLMASYLPQKIPLQNKKLLDEALIKVIAYDCQPFRIVEDIGFKEFVHLLNPGYDLPSRNTLSSSMLPAFYEDRRQYFMNFVKEHAESVCLTVDCWSSRTMDQYMGVTAHFFSKDLAIKNVLLQCAELEGSHTGSKIAEELKNIVEAWGISKKIVFLVTNNASNMLSASRILQWNHFGCFERKLYLVVQDALHTVKEIIEKVTKTVTYFKKSGTGKEKLMNYQLNNQNIQHPKTVIKALSTRWNSTYLMLERFHLLKEAIQATVATLNISLPNISNEDWICIEQICLSLKAFHEVSDVMSEENYLTASTAMVLTSSLLRICDDVPLASTTDLCLPAIDLIGKLKQGLTQRLGDIQNNLNIAICTLLDPRFKDKVFPDNQSLDRTISYTLNIMRSMIADDDFTGAAETVKNSSAGILCIWKDVDTKISSSNASKMAETKAKEELDMYLKESAISRNLCPLTWWRQHECMYPILYAIFKTNCNITVSSVPCERAFSKAGYVISDRLASLSTSKVAQIMFLNVNKIN